MLARRVLRAEFLAEYAVPGMLGPDQRANCLLGLAVGLGDGIEAALQLVGDGAGLPEARQRLGGRSGRDAPEKLSRNLQKRLPKRPLAVQTDAKIQLSMRFRAIFPYIVRQKPFRNC